MSNESVMLSNCLIFCSPLLLSPSIFPSIRVFSSESLFASGSQNIGASASVLPMNIWGWFPFSHSVQSLSHVWLFVTPWTAARQASLSFTISWSLLTLMSIDWVNDAIQSSHPLWPLSLPALNLSQHQGLFQWVSFSHQIRASASVQKVYN